MSATRRTQAKSTEAAEAPEVVVVAGAPIESTAIFGDENKADGPDPDAEVEVTLAAHWREHLPGDAVKVAPAVAEQLRLSGYATPETA